MIAGLEGAIAQLGADYAILNVGGVFYRVSMPVSSVAAIGRVGDKARVYTYLYVREDQLALYGAHEERQIHLFETLLGVTGIGPKAALSILGTMPADALENAIAEGNVDLLTRVPGIGRKTASRLVLELKGKLDLAAVAGIATTPTAAADAMDALNGLGYSAAEIQAALSNLPRDTTLTTEEIVMHALKRLGR
jgi:Holliday junction DNA helicase RuvA